MGSIPAGDIFLLAPLVTSADEATRLHGRARRGIHRISVMSYACADSPPEGFAAEALQERREQVGQTLPGSAFSYISIDPANKSAFAWSSACHVNDLKARAVAQILN